MTLYHALIKCWYRNNFTGYAAVTAWAEDPEEAEATVDEVVERWKDVEEYELIELRKTKIRLGKFTVDVNVMFREGPVFQRNKSFTIIAPDANKAVECVGEILSKWSTVTDWYVYGATAKEKV